MASPLELIKERFPKLNAFSDRFVARELYKRNYEDAQDRFANEDDYISYLLQQDEPPLADIDRFGRRVALEQPTEDQQAGILETIPAAFGAGITGLRATGRGILAGLAGEGQRQEEQLSLARQLEAQQAQQIPDNITSWRDIGGIGDLTRFAIQRFGESSPYLVAGIGGAFTGGRIGAVAGPFGALVCGIAG